MTDTGCAGTNVPGVLCLFSAPLLQPDGKPLEVLDIEMEEADIRRSVAHSHIAHLRFAFATVGELLQGMTDGFNIVHLSGHGNEDFLLFEDEKGGSQLLSKEYIKKVFARAKGIELVVVSACHSENVGRLLIDAGVKYVIAVRKDFPVYDITATAFTAQFYSTLFKGNSILQAFEIAKLAVEGNPKWDKIREEVKKRRKEEGKPYLDEERKFLLLPDDKPIDKEARVTVNDPGKTGCLVEILGKHDTNLPASQSQLFTGRAKEMHEVINLVFENKLVTIKGPGGIGKTALAIEVGRWKHLRNLFNDGVFKIDMRSMESADSVMQKIATILQVEFKEEEEFFKAVKDKDYLLILDNAEDVLFKDLKGFRQFIDGILQSTARIQLLVTSQKEIGGTLFEKEVVYNLSSLEMKDAVKLFEKRINVDRTSLNDDDFYRLITKLGGHPLSILIMAAQLNSGITVSDLLERVEKHKAKAVKGITDTDPSHGESLVLTLSSAYEHLSQKAKVVFQLLSYFPTGIDRGNLDHVMGEDCSDFVVHLLDVSLMDISYKTRLNLLPSVRLYALSVLKQEVKEEYEEKILVFIVEFAKFIYNKYILGQVVEYRTIFLMEEPNFRYMFETIKPAVDEEGDYSGPEIVAFVLLGLYKYNNWIDEGLNLGVRMLRRFKDLGSKKGEANTLQSLGDLRVRRDKLSDADGNYTQALSMYQEIGEKKGEANTLQSLGALHVRQDNLPEAVEYYTLALSKYREIGERLGEANTLQPFGDLQVRQNKLPEAEENYTRALSMYQEIGEKLGEANTWKSLGDLQVRRSMWSDAEEYYTQAQAIYNRIGGRLGEANTLQSLGDLRVRRSKLSEAEENYTQAFSVYQEIGEKLGEANTWKSFGDLQVRWDNLSEAEQNYTHALSMYQEVGSKVGEANTWKSFGDLRVRRDKLSEAEENYTNALSMYQEIGEKLGEANTLQSLGDLHVRRSKFFEAEEIYTQALSMYQEINFKLGEANTLLSKSRLAALKNDIPTSGDLLKKAWGIYVEIEAKDGQADVCEIQMLIALKQEKTGAAKKAFHQCLSIKKETQNYSEPVGWFLFYADHLNKNGLGKEATVCLEFKIELAEASRSEDLIAQLKSKG
jgi:tetratricopeptide (TPR) repeat protein